MWMRWRLIHRAVAPLSVIATMALAPEVVGREQRAHGNRLVDAAEGLAREIGIKLVVFGSLSGGANLGHLLHGFERIAPGGCFGAQHHCVGAVQHGVGHIAHLGAGGHGVGDHALHHLRGSDDHLVHVARHADHLLCSAERRGVAYASRPGRHATMMPSLARRMASGAGSLPTRSILAIQAAVAVFSGSPRLHVAFPCQSFLESSPP